MKRRLFRGGVNCPINRIRWLDQYILVAKSPTSGPFPLEDSDEKLVSNAMCILTEVMDKNGDGYWGSVSVSTKERPSRNVRDSDYVVQVRMDNTN